MATGSPTRLQRFLLPGLALKGVIIGGGYATGRELAEFFMPAGPQGGLLGMGLAMLIWCLVCAITFAFAYAMAALDYRSFFHALLGRFWPIFEVAYLFFLILVLSVFGAAAGAIGAALFGWPTVSGTLILVIAIVVVTTFGNRSVERLFSFAALGLYTVYILLAIFVFSGFGGEIVDTLNTPQPIDGWAMGGLTYASYNIVAAVIILPMVRYLAKPSDAIISGIAAGAVAMIPAILFFLCMLAWYPEIGTRTLPSDFILQKLGIVWFHYAFQFMVFTALLESGVGVVHATNERIAVAWQKKTGSELENRARFVIAICLLLGSIFVAQRFGLVGLIAHGYRALAFIFLFVFVLPLVTRGLFLLCRKP